MYFVFRHCGDLTTTQLLGDVIFECHRLMRDTYFLMYKSLINYGLNVFFMKTVPFLISLSQKCSSFWIDHVPGVPMSNNRLLYKKHEKRNTSLKTRSSIKLLYLLSYKKCTSIHYILYTLVRLKSIIVFFHFYVAYNHLWSSYV